MGQYYRGVVVSDFENDKVCKVLASLCPYTFNNGAKLREHSYIGNNYVDAYAQLLGEGGMFYGFRFAWVGDYSDEEEKWGLYSQATETTDKVTYDKYLNTILQKKKYKYLINLDKKEYVVLPECKDDEWIMHPLPLLTAVGNQRGGGDYYGKGAENIGIWAFNRIGFANAISEDYTEVEYKFETDF